MIIFTYKVSDILNNAQIQSLYRANALLQHNEEIPLDDSAATYEDQSILTNYLKKGCGVLSASMAGYGNALYDEDGITLLPALEFVSEVIADPDADPAVVGVDAQVIFRVNMPDTWNTNLALPMDEAIKDTLENYIIYRLFQIKGHNFESFFNDYTTGMSKIMEFLNMRERPIRRSYAMF